MNIKNKLITISGIHGTGKSTILNLINKKINWKEGVEREKNPFQNTFQAMLFFVCSFSYRDLMVAKDRDYNDIIIDRWSTKDIEAYIEAFENIGYLTSLEKNAIKNALNASPSCQIQPDLAIFLDSNVETILERLTKFREPSKHHIHERDCVALEELRKTFLKKFSAINNVDILKISTDGKRPEEIVCEILEHPLMKKHIKK